MATATTSRDPSGLLPTVTTARASEGFLPSPRTKTPTSKFINSLDSPDRTPNTTASTPSPSSSSSQGEFYAIRKGKGVHHCIFPSWEHAKDHVHNFKDAVYNVFDKMEDALLYIRLPSKAGGSSSTANPKRKRTAMLPCASNAIMKKPRSVSIVHAPMPRSVSMTGSSDKENQSMLTTKIPTTNKSLDVVEELEENNVEDGRPLPKILEEGYKSAYVKGWRANALFPAKKQCREKWEKRYLQDVADLKSFRQNQKNSSVRDVHKLNHFSGIPNAFSLAYLNWSWGVGEAYHRYLAFQQRKQKPAGTRQRMKNNKLKATPANRSNHYSCSTCVITNREAARKRFTSKAMFYSFRVQQLAEARTTDVSKDQLPTRPDPNDMHNQSPLVNGCSRSKDLMDEARADWETLSSEDKAYWEEQERLHDEKQPTILRILNESLARDPKRSAKRLSEDIGFWCGKTTIGKWKNLRIGPSYRKGISNPVSRADQHAHMNATTPLPHGAARNVLAQVTNSSGNQFSRPQSSANVAVVLPEVSDPYGAAPYPSQCLSNSKKAEMEAHLQEEDLLI